MTIVQLQHRFDKYLKPKLGKMPVASIAVRDLRSVLVKTQDAGNRETGHRVRALAERIFRFAIAPDMQTGTLLQTFRERWRP